MTKPIIDHTHDPEATSWVSSANTHRDFPIQNLPFGIFSPPGKCPRGGVAIGDQILDIKAALSYQLFPSEVKKAALCATEKTLNRWLALPASERRSLRHAIFDLLSSDGVKSAEAQGLAETILYPASKCKMGLPASIGDYTDFYAGINHAKNIGRLLRPDNPLMPNYKHIPIGYHGRSSTISVSPDHIVRPLGQINTSDDSAPIVKRTQKLDYELELAAWIGQGNQQGTSIAIADASQHIAGISILNDWSARDIQAWEYKPLGPFLAKSFASTLSPWIVTQDALEPFRTVHTARPNSDPELLNYLNDETDQATGAYLIDLEVSILTTEMRKVGSEPFVVGKTSAKHLYWTFAQFIAHHTSNGCNLTPGDLLGTGTISSDTASGLGSLMEINHGGDGELTLPNGETRRFLEDGDTVIMGARAYATGRRSIGFGVCLATITPTLKN